MAGIAAGIASEGYDVTVLDNLYLKQFALHEMFKYDNFDFILKMWSKLEYGSK